MNKVRGSFLIGAALCASASASADCFDDAAAYHQVHVGILRAIAMKENHRCGAETINKNTNGSVDIGCMQINTIHLPELRRHGVYPDDLKDQCKNIYIGAWHYRKKVNKYGPTWQAVGAYHSETPALRDKYAEGVMRIMLRYNLHRVVPVTISPTGG